MTVTVLLALTAGALLIGPLVLLRSFSNHHEGTAAPVRRPTSGSAPSGQAAGLAQSTRESGASPAPQPEAVTA